MSDRQIEEASFGAKHGAAAEIARDGRGVERGRHHDEAQIGPRSGLQATEQGEGEVAFQMALVELVEYDGVDAGELWVRDQAAGQDSFGEEAQAGARSGGFFEADLVAGGFANTLAKLV